MRHPGVLLIRDHLRTLFWSRSLRPRDPPLQYQRNGATDSKEVTRQELERAQYGPYLMLLEPYELSKLTIQGGFRVAVGAWLQPPLSVSWTVAGGTFSITCITESTLQKRKHV